MCSRKSKQSHVAGSPTFSPFPTTQGGLGSLSQTARVQIPTPPLSNLFCLGQAAWPTPMPQLPQLWNNDARVPADWEEAWRCPGLAHAITQQAAVNSTTKGHWGQWWGASVVPGMPCISAKRPLGTLQQPGDRAHPGTMEGTQMPAFADATTHVPTYKASALMGRGPEFPLEQEERRVTPKEILKAEVKGYD